MTSPQIERVLVNELEQHLRVASEAFTSPGFLGQVAECTLLVLEALRGDHRVFLCGNGGSAADAQHIAAEFTGHFKQERKPLPVQALNVNASSITAIGNDYGYDHIFEREVQAYGRTGDVLIGISTSGNSPNVLRAIEAAQGLGLKTIGWTGRKGGKLALAVDVAVRVPSDDTPRIQEMHITLGHAMCQAIDAELLTRNAVTPSNA